MDRTRTFRRLHLALILALGATLLHVAADALVGAGRVPSGEARFLLGATDLALVASLLMALALVWRVAGERRAAVDEERITPPPPAAGPQEGERLFRLITEDLPAAISLIGPDLRYRYANGRYRDWLGVDSATIGGRHVREVIGLEAFERGRPHMEAALAGERQTFENDLQRVDGATVPVLVNLVPNKIAGQVEGFYVMMTDVSNLKRVEEQLRVEARRTRAQLAEIEAIYDTARIGLAVLDLEGRFLRVNQRLAEINGIPVEAHLGHTLREVVPAIAPDSEEIIRKIAETGTPILDVEIVGETRAAPGAQRHWLEQWLPLRDADDHIFAVNVVVEEVTQLRHYQREQQALLAEVVEQRKRAEALTHELQEERDVLDTIMEHTSTQLAYLDPAFNFVRVNSAYAKGSQLPREQLIGRNHFSLFPNEENEAIFERVWRTGQPAEFRGRPFHYAGAPERGLTYWDWTLVPVRNPAGVTQGLVFSLTDVTEQKRAEDVLRRARDELELAVRRRTQDLTVAIDALDEENAERRRVEAQLRLILNQIPALLWTTDTELRYTSLQGAGAQSLSLRVEDAIGQPIAGSYDGPDGGSEAAMDAHRRALTGESVTFRSSWGGVYYEGYVEPLHAEDGSITGCIGVALDITRRQAAEEALRASESRFRAFFENAPVGVAIQDPGGRIIEANPALRRLLGQEDLRLEGQRWSDFVHPEDVESDFDLFAEMISGKRANYQVEKRLLPVAGDERWVRLTVSVARDPAGGPRLVVSMAEDITESKEASRELAERERQYRSIFEATSDGLVILDFGGRVVDVNPAALAISGYSRDEFTRRKLWDLVTPERRQSFERFLTLARGTERLETQTMGLRRDGSLFDLEVRSSRLTYRGEPHLLNMVRDITERVRSIQLLETRVQERTRELSALLDASRSISATLEQRPLARAVTDQIEQLLPTASVLLFTMDGHELVLVEHRGFQRDAAADELIDLSDPRVREEARRQETPYVVADFTSDPVTGFPARIYETMRRLLPGGRSLLWAPLCVKGRVVGGLAVVHNDAGRFSEREAGLLATVANQAAVALENARLYEQARELAILQERQRLARELHDSVTQALYSLVLMTEATRRLLLLNQTERLTVFLGRIADTAQQVLKEMRLLVYELRPTVLARDGLVSALRQRLQTVEGRAGVDAQLLVTGSAYIPEPVEGELYRVAQEALNNSLKHSGASSVTVRLDLQPTSVCLKVTDNGRGFAVDTLAEGGMGLASMKERAQRLGGELDLSSVAGQGTAVSLRIPLTAEEVQHG